MDSVVLKDVQSLFPSSVRSSLKVKVEGNHAILELEGKYNKSKWNKTLEEVRGWGGLWVKGHFIMPIPQKDQKSG